MNTAQEARSYAHQENWESIKPNYNKIINSIEAASKKGKYGIDYVLKLDQAAAIIYRLKDDGFFIDSSRINDESIQIKEDEHSYYIHW